MGEKMDLGREDQKRKAKEVEDDTAENARSTRGRVGDVVACLVDFGAVLDAACETTQNVGKQVATDLVELEKMASTDLEELRSLEDEKWQRTKARWLQQLSGLEAALAAVSRTQELLAALITCIEASQGVHEGMEGVVEDAMNKLERSIDVAEVGDSSVTYLPLHQRAATSAIPPPSTIPLLPAASGENLCGSVLVDLNEPAKDDGDNQGGV